MAHAPGASGPDRARRGPSAKLRLLLSFAVIVLAGVVIVVTGSTHSLVDLAAFLAAAAPAIGRMLGR